MAYFAFAGLPQQFLYFFFDALSSHGQMSLPFSLTFLPGVCCFFFFAGIALSVSHERPQQKLETITNLLGSGPANCLNVCNFA